MKHLAFTLAFVFISQAASAANQLSDYVGNYKCTVRLWNYRPDFGLKIAIGENAGLPTFSFGENHDDPPYNFDQFQMSKQFDVVLGDNSCQMGSSIPYRTCLEISAKQKDPTGQLPLEIMISSRRALRNSHRTYQLNAAKDQLFIDVHPGSSSTTAHKVDCLRVR